MELGREVVRDNPLGINEGATGEAQLWVLVSQIRQELELARKADVLVTDRGVMDNYAYYLRSCGGTDALRARAAGPPLVRDLRPRGAPAARTSRSRPTASGPRTTRSATRSRPSWTACCPTLVPDGRLVTLRASEVTSRFDWFAVLERLAASVGATVAPRPIWT